MGFLLARSVTTTALWVATTARRRVRQTTARERQSVTRARTASAPTARPTRTAPRGRSAATDSVQSHAITTQLQLLNQLQLQLLNQQPLTHPALPSAAQMTIVRTEYVKTENVFPTQRLVETRLQLQLASLSAAQTTTAQRVLSVRTENARSLATMMPTAMVPMKSAIPLTTTASTALQTTSVKMDALVTQTAGRRCPAAVLLTAAQRSATRP